MEKLDSKLDLDSLAWENPMHRAFGQNWTPVAFQPLQTKKPYLRGGGWTNDHTGSALEAIVTQIVTARGSVGPWVRAFVRPWVGGSVSPWVRGSVGPWVHGSVGPCLHGSVGPWVDPWVGGWADAFGAA